MKVLVTGATGLLGGNIVKELLTRGYETRIFIRETSKVDGLKNLPIEKVKGDLLNQDDVLKAVSGCDAVIHAAANSSQVPTGYQYYEQPNVTATLHILQAVKNLGIARLIYVSTANAFGFGTRKKPGTELSEFRSFGYHSGYIMSKYLAQQHILYEVERSNVPAVIVNPGFMIGPYDTRPSSGEIIFRGLKNIVLCPPGGKSFIHVQDVARATCNALHSGSIGECYLLTNQNMTFLEFFRLLNRITGRRSRIVKVPASVLNTFGFAGSMYEMVTSNSARLNFTNSRLLCAKHFYNSGKAKDDLGLSLTPVEQAITDALSWFTENGYLDREYKSLVAHR